MSVSPPVLRGWGVCVAGFFIRPRGFLLELEMKNAVSLIVAALIVAGLVGWCMNIADIIGMLDGPINAMLIVRVVGIFFAPLGAILGYF